MSTIARHVRLSIIVLGFASSMLGTVGSFVMVDTLNRELKGLADERDRSSRDAERLGELAAQYFVANQQGDLIYSLSVQGSARPDVTALLFKGNLLDRATPVRNLIGALATAQVLDYRATYSAYEALNDAARASGRFDDYQAVKRAEQAVVETAYEQVRALHARVADLEPRITGAAAALRARQVLILALSSLGACLLLAANLADWRINARAPGAPPPPSAPAPSSARSPRRRPRRSG